MLRLSTVLVFPELGLTRVAGPRSADPEVKWAHVSELHDPTPWLAGQELLLTTGLDLFRDPTDTFDYCARLAATGVAALGLSTGGSLPHNTIPAMLVDAADASGLVLVHVPEDTALQSVVRRVSDALNQEQTEPLRRALLAQRQLSEAAVSPDGVDAVLRAFASNTSFISAVYDPTLRLVASSGAVAQNEFELRRDEIRDRMFDGLRWSITTDDAVDATVVSPLGTQGRLRGVMIAVKRGQMSTYDRAILSMVTSLLCVLLELRHSGNYQNRVARGRAVDALTAGNLSPIEATVRLARAGVECTTVQCVSLPEGTSAPLVTAIVSGLKDACSDVLTRRRAGELIMLLCDPTEEVAAALTEILAKAGTGPVGMGTVVNPENSALSLRQAARARDLAKSRNVPFIALQGSSGYRAMLMLGDPAERANFADAVLQPLDDKDLQGTSQLVLALRSFLENASNVESAAIQLGVHRHTMRARLAKISELTGRDLNNASDLLELWLASEFREMAQAEGPSRP
ncbi:hypothetical protein ART_3579 [Arthrobacter sp. PAMC 25486]|uniref:PucR family transcriptional regulator n=1 Tax=Arthrobacter sp. PAMC 25486 TaxID=1494608 RepID=UPI000536094B|nr:PucR family transcriptional regulator [Arthrobacter sp. PAMC 25486]AIY03178.1 hypothetical protein ART_3579 [Arthrobacter sp. PAMC 25486]